MTGQENVEADVIRIVGNTPENKMPVDPAASTEHLTPKGKRKHKVIDRSAQSERFVRMQDKRANEDIPSEVTATPGDNLEIKIKKVQGIDD